ncbi:MAG: hypothetical protein KIS96_01105 [Bauldia sp.]|nr:hypothetical protein [Bauldia sp.]
MARQISADNADAGDLALDRMIDRQIADMRRLLALMSEASATDALRALRAAFPDASLAARTAAVTGWRL